MQAIIKTKNDHVYIFETEEDNISDYFKRRESITRYNFPRYITGHVSDSTELTGWNGTWQEFADFPNDNMFDDLRIQNILTITIDGININDDIQDIAQFYGAEASFPLIYHIQFTFYNNPDWVFNWYPTTGTLNKQKKTEKYFRMQKLGTYKNIEEALKACIR